MFDQLTDYTGNAGRENRNISTLGRWLIESRWLAPSLGGWVSLVEPTRYKGRTTTVSHLLEFNMCALTCTCDASTPFPSLSDARPLSSFSPSSVSRVNVVLSLCLTSPNFSWWLHLHVGFELVAKKTRNQVSFRFLWLQKTLDIKIVHLVVPLLKREK